MSLPTVGVTSGVGVTSRVGDRVGDKVSASVGAAVGASVGTAVGARVDAEVGVCVGSAVGFSVGVAVGSAGASVGWLVGVGEAGAATCVTAAEVGVAVGAGSMPALPATEARSKPCPSTSTSGGSTDGAAARAGRVSKRPGRKNERMSTTFSRRRPRPRIRELIGKNWRYIITLRKFFCFVQISKQYSWVTACLRNGRHKTIAPKLRAQRLHRTQNLQKYQVKRVHYNQGSRLTQDEMS